MGDEIPSPYAAAVSKKRSWWWRKKRALSRTAGWIDWVDRKVPVKYETSPLRWKLLEDQQAK